VARPAGLEFKSKIDWWILITLLLVVAACIAPIAQNWRPFVGELWWASLLLAPGILFPLWLLFGTRYYLSDEKIDIRCGPMGWTVPIAEIESISPSETRLSGPALSLDRLLIRYSQTKEIVISPEPRKAFLEQLEFRRKQLRPPAEARAPTKN
jgi:hypothetical protein